MAKILIVDDEPQFRRVLHLALAAQGYDIREAANGVAALRLMQCEQPDLLLLDWLMPDIDGLRLCRVIRTLSDVPIILVTSRLDGRSAAMAAGANAYLQKPFGVEELLAQVLAALTVRTRRPSRKS